VFDHASGSNPRRDVSTAKAEPIIARRIIQRSIAVFDSIKKVCTKCGIPKPLGDFQRDTSKKIGYDQPCKECRNKANKERYKNNPEKHKAAARQWSQVNPTYHAEWTRVNPKKMRVIAKRLRIKFPEKTKARVAVAEAIKLGKLPRAKSLKCVRCGNPAQDYHHHKGYAREHWLDVVPVCKKCHPVIESS